MMAPTKMKLRMRKREGGAKLSQRLVAAEASPDSKCPICLDRFNNVASLDRCLHRFCFRCIHEWSKNKAECPLCKQPFCSIFHSVRAENDFKEFVLAPVENGPAAVAGPPAGQADGGVGDPAGRARRSVRVRERWSRRRSNPAPSAMSSPGVRLESVAGVEQERGVQRVMLRLTERRHSRAAEQSLRRLRDQDVVGFRRALYRTGVRVRARSAWDGGRPQDISAAYLRRNPACLRRLLPWLQRELTVLYGSHGSLVSVVQHVIMTRIAHHDMDGVAIRDELRPFLLARTDHFLHELVNFARSTLSIEAYDQQAVYECTAPSYEEDSTSDSSIIAISEGDGDNDSEGADLVPPVPMATGGESSLSQSAWDDETPGPSYSTLFPSPSQSQAEGAVPAAASVQPDKAGSACGGPCEEEEECMIVGYVKPMAERTPELVQLSSNSEEEEEKEKEGVAPETPAATVTKTESSLSQAQALPSSQSYMSPLSPPSCRYPSPSHSPQHMPVRGSNSEERDAARPADRREHAPRRGCRSSSVSSGLSECTRTSSRSHKRPASVSRHGEPSRQEETSGQSHQSAGRSPTVSVLSDVSSASWEPPRSKKARSVSARERSSQSSVCWDSPARDGERRRARERRPRRRRDGGAQRDRSPSPPHSYSIHSGCRRDSRRRHGHRERCPRSSSPSSSSDSSGSSDSPRPEKPAGKRKYKTRHLEEAAQRQGRRKGRGRERRTASRSPSVEIVFERLPADTRSHADPWRRKRKRRRNRRDAREQSSPAVITIDSDSERDHVTARPGPVDDAPACVMDSQICVPEFLACCVKDCPTPPLAVPSLDSLLGSYGPATPCQLPTGSPECTLNLEFCAVDVVDHDPVDSSPPGTASNLHEDVTVATETLPSDTRLLESILQELEDILPETRPALDGGDDQQMRDTVTHRDQPEAMTQAVHTHHNEAVCESERGARTSPAV